MNTKKLLLEKLLEFFNSVSSVLVNLDDLSTTKDSICICETETVQEVPDLTSPNYVSGNGTLSIIYRGITIDDGIDDMNYTSYLDSLTSSLIKSYKTIQGNGYSVDAVKILQSSKIDAVYPDGTKDFKTLVQIDYQRKLF